MGIYLTEYRLTDVNQVAKNFSCYSYQVMTKEVIFCISFLIR